MVSTGAIAITLGLISSFFISTHGVDNTDEKRPYEFGFNIEGEQHRHEKKDERGLIMGEFGFITADGVYHVTVYATDEEGRFKILSMKNIRVKPYPTYKQPSGPARQGHSLDVADPQKALSQQTSPSQNPDTPFKKITIEKPARSCSSCSLPTTTTQAPAPAIGQPNIQNTPFLPNQQNFPANQQNFPANQQNFPANQQNFPANQQSFPANQQNFLANQQSFPANQQNFPANQQSFPANQQNFPANQQSFPANQQNFPAKQQNNFNNPQSYNQQIPSISQNVPAESQNSVPQAPDQGLVAPKQELPLYPPLDSPQNYPQGQQSPVSNNPAQPSYISQNPETLQNNPFGNNAAPQPNSNTGRTAKKLDNVPQLNSVGALPNRAFNQNQEIPNKPTLISAQMQIVDKNTDIHKRGPGEKEGLPEGLTKNDMSQLLYTFNYTVGFHGHFEEGYRNGAKQGYYFVTGRNGVRTRVDYVADDKGFRPKITQEVLDLISEEVPKPETEKDEKYGLKGYEFKWLYFPADPKGR